MHDPNTDVCYYNYRYNTQRLLLNTDSSDDYIVRRGCAHAVFSETEDAEHEPIATRADANT